MMAEMKAGFEDKMEAGQERLEKEIRSGQERMEKGQEEMKGLIDEVKGEVQRKIDEVEKKIQMKVEKIESEVQRKIEESRAKFKRRSANLERRISELEERPNYFPASLKFMSSRPTVKPLTFDGQASWTVFKTQFDVVSSTNGWTDFVKASQVVASLRGSVAEVLQGIPADKLTDLTTIERALESRFGDSHLTQFYRTELKTRRKKPGESLQELAVDVELLMSLAYAECRLDVRESLAAQYFVDTIRDEDTQHSTRLMHAKDLKSSLAYSMKYETARTVSKTFRHVRSIETKDHMSRERDDAFEFFFYRLEKLLNSGVAGKKNTPRRNERDLLEVQKEGARSEGVPGDYFEPGKLTYGCLAGRRQPFQNRAPEEGLKISSLSGKKNGLYLEGSICGIQCLMLVDTGANVTLLRTDLAQKLKEQPIYTAPNISLKTATGEKTKIREKLVHPLNVAQENLITEST
ncbi:hypothetical protein AVEN_123595-1 [Araneus ventricosus]|uniref:Peptidase A2 domain-containing protein n=1 Tax=Araneus ventricosus TaxID=182803 RepID=A0A4Y2HZS0_ARAVE|nr:hypothetical protein AVEN_82100-1 [Araneus ventricosus]GBM70436.1 hypothetical protein AVEN_123595-1 [Araneus ventricosus]